MWLYRWIGRVYWQEKTTNKEVLQTTGIEENMTEWDQGQTIKVLQPYKPTHLLVKGCVGRKEGAKECKWKTTVKVRREDWEKLLWMHGEDTEQMVADSHNSQPLLWRWCLTMMRFNKYNKGNILKYSHLTQQALSSYLRAIRERN